MRLQAVNKLLRKFQRQQVRVREIAIIMRFFFRAHRAGFAFGRVIQPGFLINGAAVFQNTDLAARFHINGLADKADRIDVFDFAARAKWRANLMNGHVNVRAQAALIHIAVARAQIAHNGTDFGDIGAGLVRRADVRLRHDFHQRNAGAVQIHIALGGTLVVQAFASVLLQMQPLNADNDLLGGRHIDDHFALPHNRAFILADLIALRQIRIEIVFAVKARLQVDLCLQAKPGTHSLRNTLFIDHGEHARHSRVHQRYMRVFGSAISG